MTEYNLSTVTLDTIENYRNAVGQTVEAYRVGSHRLANLVNERLNSSLYPRADKIVPTVSEQVYRVQNRAFELTANGIDLISDNTGRLINIGANSAASGVHRIANRAAEVHNPYLSKSIEAATRFNLPSAKLALAISVKLADGAEGLLSIAAGPVSERVKTSARNTANRARKTATSATRNFKASVKTASNQTAKAKAKIVRKTRIAASKASA